MKKFFAVLLAVMLLPVFALAEETQPITVKVNDTLSLSVLIPDGYGFDQEWYGDMLYAQMNPEEEGKLLMVLSLGYSEEYADRSINDLSDEELDSLIAVSMSDFANPTYTLSETAEGTKLRECYGKEEIDERHRHRYEFNNDYRAEMQNHGLVISGTSPDGRLVEAVELPGRDFHVGVQFHPEFKSRPNRAHPLFKGFIAAALRYRAAAQRDMLHL